MGQDTSVIFIYEEGRQKDRGRERRKGGREREMRVRGVSFLVQTSTEASAGPACVAGLRQVDDGGEDLHLYSAVDQNDSSRPTPGTRSQQEEREAGHSSNIALASWLPRLGRCYLEGSSRIWISWAVTRRTGGSPTCDEGRAQ